MGWDAISSAEYNWVNKKFDNLRIGQFFINADNHIRQQHGFADANLKIGSLDSSTCAQMLQKATGHGVYDENGWSVEQLREYNRKAKWNFCYDSDDTWAYWSARKFLEICAHCNLSIRFSF